MGQNKTFAMVHKSTMDEEGHIFKFLQSREVKRYNVVPRFI
jgi:hypothetical protein